MTRAVGVRPIWVAFVLLITTVLQLPCSLHAAQPAQRIVRVGFVSPQSISTVPTLPALWSRLRELGWIEGENLVTEVRSAEGKMEALPSLMAELVAAKIDVLVTVGTPAAIAAKKATPTIPIVVAAMGDPLGTGLTNSLARPGANLTGLSLEMTEDLTGKWLQLLKEAVPRLSTVAVISNPDSPLIGRIRGNLTAIAPRHKVKLLFADVRAGAELEKAFKQAHRDAQAMVLLPDPLTMNHVPDIAALAAKYQLPAMYPLLDFMNHGGLMAYAVDTAVLFRRTAEYVDKILRGANPAELPIEQPTQFRLVVNLKTAKSLGLAIPQSILLRADEVMR